MAEDRYTREELRDAFLALASDFEHEALAASRASRYATSPTALIRLQATSEAMSRASRITRAVGLHGCADADEGLQQ